MFSLDTGIANEKDWGINLVNASENESGTNEDGSTWYRESGEDLGDNGYRCRWTRMGGQSVKETSEWKETVCTYYIRFYAILFRIILWVKTICVVEYWAFEYIYVESTRILLLKMLLY